MVKIIQLCFFFILYSFVKTHLKPISQKLLEVVLSSPEACKQKNKTNWLSLFSKNATCEDPIGTTKHVGKNDLSLFWETFIAPTNLTFTSHYDIISEETSQVLRFVDITASFPEDGVNSNQPAIILYTLQSNGEVYEIESLKAYWVLINRVNEEFYQKGGINNLFRMGYKLFYNYGISGLIGYIQGFNGVGTKGKTWSFEFFNSLVIKDHSKYFRLVKKQTLQIIQIMYTDRKVIYENNDYAINLFWEEYVIEGKLTNLNFEKNNLFNSGFNVAGAFVINWNNQTINSAFIHKFNRNSEIESINIWINYAKFK